MNIDYSSIANALKENAPMIAAALCGPFAAATVASLCVIFGCQPGHLIESIEKSKTNDNLSRMLKNFPLIK